MDSNVASIYFLFHTVLLYKDHLYCHLTSYFLLFSWNFKVELCFCLPTLYSSELKDVLITHLVVKIYIFLKYVLKTLTILFYLCSIFLKERLVLCAKLSEQDQKLFYCITFSNLTIYFIRNYYIFMIEAM